MLLNVQTPFGVLSKWYAQAITASNQRQTIAYIWSCEPYMWACRFPGWIMWIHNFKRNKNGKKKLFQISAANICENPSRIICACVWVCVCVRGSSMQITRSRVPSSTHVIYMFLPFQQHKHAECMPRNKNERVCEAADHALTQHTGRDKRHD